MTKIHDIEYLFEIPAEVPAGRVVAHNSVKPQPELGMNGFRAWMEDLDSSKHVVCNCDWAPELGKHYRIQPKPVQ